MNVKRSQHNSGVRRTLSQTRAFVFAMLTATAVAATAQQTNVSSALDFNSFQIIAQRNIFNQSRVPHKRAVQPTRVADSFSFVGALFYAGGDFAFFNGTGEEYRKALQVGGDIAGFKVTAVTLNSVTLTDGTNQTVLKITSQMRRDEAGHWSVSTERASYGSTGNAAGLNAGRYSGRSRRYNSTRNNFTTMPRPSAGNEAIDNSSSPGAEEPPSPEIDSNPSPASGGANDALTRLMQRRAQQEQQLGQGQ